MCLCIYLPLHSCLHKSSLECADSVVQYLRTRDNTHQTFNLWITPEGKKESYKKQCLNGRFIDLFDVTTSNILMSAHSISLEQMGDFEAIKSKPTYTSYYNMEQLGNVLKFHVKYVRCISTKELYQYLTLMHSLTTLRHLNLDASTLLLSGKWYRAAQNGTLDVNRFFSFLGQLTHMELRQNCWRSCKLTVSNWGAFRRLKHLSIHDTFYRQDWLLLSTLLDVDSGVIKCCRELKSLFINFSLIHYYARHSGQFPADHLLTLSNLFETWTSSLRPDDALFLEFKFTLNILHDSCPHSERKKVLVPLDTLFTPKMKLISQHKTSRLDAGTPDRRYVTQTGTYVLSEEGIHK